MVDRTKYENSSLDVARLRRFAKRVSTECRKPRRPPMIQAVTKEETYLATEKYGPMGLRTRQVRKTRTVRIDGLQVVAAHWVLHRTHHNIDEHHSWGHSEYHEDNYWILQADGTLVKCTRWIQEQTIQPFARDGISAAAMTADDILRLDFEDRTRTTGRPERGTHTYGNRDPGRLIRHAKGVGLSLALKSLLP